MSGEPGPEAIRCHCGEVVETPYEFIEHLMHELRSSKCYGTWHFVSDEGPDGKLLPFSDQSGPDQWKART
jgi:hypothetical protein